MPRPRRELTVADLYDNIIDGPTDDAHDDAVWNARAQLSDHDVSHIRVSQGTQKVSFGDGREVLHLDLHHVEQGKKMTPQEIHDALNAVMRGHPGKVAKVLRYDGTKWSRMEQWQGGHSIYDDAYIDYEKGEGASNAGDSYAVSVMLHDPSDGDAVGAGENNNCLWEALCEGTDGKRCPLPDARIKTGAFYTEITTPHLFRLWLTSVAGPFDVRIWNVKEAHPDNSTRIPASGAVWQAIDKAIGSTWALRVVGVLPYTSPKKDATRVLSLTMTPNHIEATKTAFDQRTTDPLLERWRMAIETGQRPIRVRDASTPYEWIARPRSAPVLLLRREGNETPEATIARYHQWSDAIDALEYKPFEGLNPYRLTGDLGFCIQLMFKLGRAKGLAVEPEPLEYIESLWLRLALGCSLTYNATLFNVDCTLVDANSWYPTLMCSNTSLPYLAGRFDKLTTEQFEEQKKKGFFSIGIYRLKRAPLEPLLGGTDKPFRAACRGTRGIESRKFAKLAGAELSEFWTSADLEAALMTLPPEALQIDDDGNDNVLLYGKGRVKAVDLFGAAAKCLYDARKRDPDCKLYKKMLVMANGKLAERNIWREYYAPTEEEIKLPVNFKDQALIERVVKDESGKKITEVEYFKPGANPVYRNASARALPFIQGAARRDFAKLLGKLPQGSVLRVYTDSVVVRSDDKRAMDVIAPFLGENMGSFKIEHSGMYSSPSLLKSGFHTCRVCAAGKCKKFKA